MHEMTLALNLIDLATETAREAQAKRITHIELEMGALSGVMKEALVTCFEVAKQHTLAQDCQLKIIDVPGRGQCPVCQHKSEIESFANRCPQCGNWGLTILEGKDLRVTTITID